MNLVNSEPHEAFITRCHARVRRSPPAMVAFLFRQAPGERLQRRSDYLFAAIFKEHLDTSFDTTSNQTRQRPGSRLP